MESYIAVSGGKDSTALALILPNAQMIFTDTGWDFPELYTHLDKIEQITGREIIRIQPNGSLPDYIQTAKFMPGHAARFCTRMFKIQALDHWFEQNTNGPVTLSIGLRADEPDRRGNFSQVERVDYRYPFREQGIGINDVLSICLEYDLLPRYPIYMARGGCKGCFYKRKSEIYAMQQLCPDILDELQALEESVQDDRGRFALMFPNAGASIRDIRRQQFMFDPEKVYADASQNRYGQACGLFCNR